MGSRHFSFINDPNKLNIVLTILYDTTEKNVVIFLFKNVSKKTDLMVTRLSLDANELLGYLTGLIHLEESHSHRIKDNLSSHYCRSILYNLD